MGLKTAAVAVATAAALVAVVAAESDWRVAFARVRRVAKLSGIETVSERYCSLWNSTGLWQVQGERRR